jgi:hypothetical protein
MRSNLHLISARANPLELLDRNSGINHEFCTRLAEGDARARPQPEPCRPPDGRAPLPGDPITNRGRAAPFRRPHGAGMDRFARRCVMRAMDRQTKHEIWLLALGTAILEVPVAIAAFVILSQ